jgi:hypothetical protein
VTVHVCFLFTLLHFTFSFTNFLRTHTHTHTHTRTRTHSHFYTYTYSHTPRNTHRYFSTIRDFYEAYVIYTFIALLIAIAEDGNGMTALLTTLTQRYITEQHMYEDALISTDSGNSDANGNGSGNGSGSGSGSSYYRTLPKRHVIPPWPCCYDNRRPVKIAIAWLYQCKLMAMQFVFMKPILTAVPLVCWLTGFDEQYNNHSYLRYDGTLTTSGRKSEVIDWYSIKLYVLILSNISVIIAFYGLLTFYYGLEKDLAWCNPWPKFLCIKGVVFMTFWQGLAFQSMAYTGIIDNKQAIQIQNLVTCIEMLLGTSSHHT